MWLLPPNLSAMPVMTKIPMNTLMRRLVGAVCWLLAVTLMTTSPASAGEDFAEVTAGLQPETGFIEVYRDVDAGRLLMHLPAANSDGSILRLIHAVRLSGGLGSNPLGLDRGWGNSGQLLHLRRIGPRVVFEVENHRYRAETDNTLEQQAVSASFANSFIWSTDIVASADDGSLLIDVSGLLTLDLLGLAATLNEDGSGFTQAKQRSLPDLASLLVFPDNVEIDAFVTFTSSRPGDQVSATAANPNHVTLRQHHSFVRLPEPGYRPRRADPRSGTFTLGYYDYAAALHEPLLRGVAMRHRLQYKEPGNAASGVREPIVFYIDAGAPPAIQQALQEGANWWREAFAAAGFADGYRVEILPTDAHPLDIRYNVVQWVHRQTRGWSYGGGIIDPRSGEFIKGHVILGSQRIRHDRMIFEGLAGTAHSASGSADDPVQLALQRIRQLAAHEVGHALGFGHNFAASSNDRASVMDYPAPWISVNDAGQLDFSRAYASGIGAWDKVTARWLYGDFPPQTERQQLEAILSEAKSQGLLFIADQHARGVGTAHPGASVWDNGDDAVDELNSVLAVRRHALENFAPDRVRAGQPLAALREVLTPIYLYHRYQLNAAAKAIGGLWFDYRQRPADLDSVLAAEQATAWTPVARAVSASQQLRALEALVSTLDTALLDLPETLLQMLPPANHGYWFTVPGEGFEQRSGVLFDLLAAAETAADLSYTALLDPQRLERMLQQHLRAAVMPSLELMLERIEQQLRRQLAAASEPRQIALAGVLQQRYITRLLQLDEMTLSAPLAASIQLRLQQLQRSLVDSDRRDRLYAQQQWLARRIMQQLQRPAPAASAVPATPATPPGSPIGSSGGNGPDHGSGPGMPRGRAASYGWISEDCWHCDSH